MYGFCKKIDIELWLAFAIALGAVLINALYYHDALSFDTSFFWLLRYFTFGNPYFAFFFLFAYLVFLQKFYIKVAGITSDWALKGCRPTKKDRRELLSCLWTPLYLLAPLALVSGPIFTLLANISYQLRSHTLDNVFLQADASLFSGYPFLVLPSIVSAKTVVQLLEFSYFSLAIVMSFTLGLLFLLQRQELFRAAIIAFLLSLTIGFPLFYLFPCQDPYNYFLRNIRGHTFGAEIEQALKRYEPSLLASRITTQIGESETNSEHDNTVPVSCFPSMHAVWAFFVVYFLAKITPFSLVFTVPWTLLLLTGGVYFAQHYVVDYIVAVPVAIASIYLAALLLRFERHIHVKLKKPQAALS